MRTEAEPTTAEDIGHPLARTLMPPFFAVSVTKLSVLSLCSFGVYPLYWFYHHWKIVRDQHGEDVRPIVRTVLNNFYCYALFSRILARGKDAQISPFPAALCAVAWFVFNILWKLPDPYWLVSTLSFVWLIPAQYYANQLNAAAAPDHDRNARFSGWNKALVGLGAIWWLLVVLGLSFPEVPPDT